MDHIDICVKCAYLGKPFWLNGRTYFGAHKGTITKDDALLQHCPDCEYELEHMMVPPAETPQQRTMRQNRRVIELVRERINAAEQSHL